MDNNVKIRAVYRIGKTIYELNYFLFLKNKFIRFFVYSFISVYVIFKLSLFVFCITSLFLLCFYFFSKLLTNHYYKLNFLKYKIFDIKNKFQFQGIKYKNKNKIYIFMTNINHDKLLNNKTNISMIFKSEIDLMITNEYIYIEMIK